jgi:hypothetical protein
LHKYSSIHRLPQTIAVLVRAEQPEEAARIFRSGWPNIALDWPQSAESRHDAEIVSRLPALLEKLERGDEKYLAQVLFASIPDAPNPADAAAPTRDERLTSLAEEFPKVEFKDAAMKKVCLVLLSSSDPAGKQIAGEVAAAYDQKALLVAAANNDQTRLTQETRLATRHFRNRLREGDVAQFVELVQKLAANPIDQDYQFGQNVSPFIECGVEALREKGGQPWSAEQCAALAEALRRTLLNRDYVNINNFENFTSLVVALHCRADKMAELKDWLTKISNYSQSRINNGYLRDDFWQLGVRLIGPPTAENLDARIQYAQNFLRWVFERQWIRRDGGRPPYAVRNVPAANVLTTVVASGLISADELKAHGAQITAGIGTKDEINYAKAAFAAWLQANKNYDAAVEVWRSIIQIDPANKNVAGHQVRYVFGLTMCLQELGQAEEAAKALAQLDGKEIPPTTRRDYDKLQQQLKAQRSAADPPKEKAAEPAAKEQEKKNSTGTKEAA